MYYEGSVKGVTLIFYILQKQIYLSGDASTICEVHHNYTAIVVLSQKITHCENIKEGRITFICGSSPVPSRDNGKPI